jgi:hypothetical protein
MNPVVGVTKQAGAADAGAEIREQWGPASPSLVVYFCSPKVDGCGLGRALRATRVDEARRVVHEFDGRPALEAYADAIGVPAGEAAGYFHRYSLGLMVGGEPYVRSVQRAEGSDLVLYCGALKGMDLEVLEAGDVVEDTRRALEAKRQELGGLGALLVFDCILRGSGMRKQGLENEYGAVFQGAPTAGFLTYGEQYLGHISHSATMIAFGR